MNTITPDELHRLVKLAMDTGEANSIEHAHRIFAGYRIGLAVGPEIATSGTHQAAFATFVRLASRVFLGGMDVVMPAGLEIPDLLLGNLGIEETMAAFGARRKRSLEPHVPAVCIGTVSLPHSASFSIRAVFSGWRAGVVPAEGLAPFEFETELPLSGALAAALAVNEAFLFVRQHTLEAGFREIGLSLWKPGAVADWWKAENDGPPLAYLPSKLWLIGLGHLGQAYLWGLSLLPYARPEDVELVLQDVDAITPATLSTSILSDCSMLGQRKTRAIARVAEARGFRTAIVERKFDETLRIGSDDPQIALCGVDNALARRALCDAGFKLVVEAGLGSGSRDFRAIRVHTFPGTRDPRELWKPRHEGVACIDAPAYGDLAARGLDQCGVTLLAGRAVGAPFVGMTAAAICVSEILRLLHDGEVFSVHELDLKVPASRVCVERGVKLVGFNPGFTPISSTCDSYNH